MKKVTSKKLIGSLLIIILLTIIGAVLVTAETSDTTLDEENVDAETNDETEDNNPTTFGDRRYMCRQRPFFFNLTEEQREEIDKIVANLKEEGASREEIAEAIFAKLDEFGIPDKRLDNEIECTEKKLEILYREKELREEGYSWDEIKDIIQEEFDLELPYGDDQAMKFGNYFRCGPIRGHRGLNHGEEFDR